MLRRRRRRRAAERIESAPGLDKDLEALVERLRIECAAGVVPPDGLDGTSLELFDTPLVIDRFGGVVAIERDPASVEQVIERIERALAPADRSPRGSVPAAGRRSVRRLLPGDLIRPDRSARVEASPGRARTS